MLEVSLTFSYIQVLFLTPLSLCFPSLHAITFRLGHLLVDSCLFIPTSPSYPSVWTTFFPLTAPLLDML